MREIRITTDVWNDTAVRSQAPEDRYAANPRKGLPLRVPDETWVERALASLSPEEKVGQLIATHKHKYGEELMREFHVGGFVFLGNDLRAEEIVDRRNALQQQTPFPLWFGIDAEAGIGARVSDATIFPLMMAFGAADDPALAEECGRITAREAHALGLHAAYGPVVDVLTDFRSPAISTRAAGNDAALVEALGRAFVRGARAEGVLPTFKHYPGHGDTHTDSHKDLPVIEASREEVERTHLSVFRNLIASGDTELLMTGHLWFPAYHPDSPWPSTLSPLFNEEILRRRFGFDGVLLSDAFNMAGMTSAAGSEGERAVLALEAGVDVILVSDDIEGAVAGVREALETGRLSTERLDTSVRRILRAKSRTHLPEAATVDPEGWRETLNHPVHRRVVRRVCERAFTRVSSSLQARPALRRGERVLTIALQGSSKIFYRFPSTIFEDALRARIPDVQCERLSREAGGEERGVLLEQAARADKIVVLGYDWSRIYSEGQTEFLRTLTRQDVPVIYLSFGSPFHLLDIPGMTAHYCGYCSLEVMQEMAAEVLTGEKDALGKLPVRLQG